MANRRVTQMAPDGTLTVVADKWDGKRFNQPNDLWIDAKGGIYVTDPIYMTVKDREIETEDLYYIKPESREVLRVAEGMVRPNGVIGAKDGKTLYVGDHGGNKTYVFDIQEDGTLANKRVFADSGSDGMTLDERGNVYLTGGKEVKIFDKNGVSLPSIPVPDRTTNVTFGGKDRNILFITSPEAVYKIPMRVKGQ